MKAEEISRLFDAWDRRRLKLARMPIEEKIRAVVRLQELAAPILRSRGKTVRCWKLDS